MTVAQLITELQKMPQGRRVMIPVSRIPAEVAGVSDEEDAIEGKVVVIR